MKENSYAILGLNRYGLKLAHTIALTGADVLIADENQDMINLHADNFTFAACLDLTNQNALSQIGLEQVDVAIVDLSENLEAAIVSVMVAKEQGVSKVIATAKSDRFREVLMRVGADEVVIPEDAAAAQMARLLITDDFMTYFDIGGDLCVIKVSPKREWKNKSLRQLNLPETQQINIIAIEKAGEINAAITADTIIPNDCTLVMATLKTNMYDFV